MHILCVPALAALPPSGPVPVAGVDPTMLAPTSTSLAAASSALVSRASFSTSRDARNMPKGSTKVPSSERPSLPIVGEARRACHSKNKKVHCMLWK